MANKQKSSSANKNDGLYLLEVLVSRIVFEKAPCFADNDFRTCVSIKCLEQDPLLICDDESGTRSSGPFVKNMGSGKSCLFNLSDSEVKKASEKFELKVNVYKEMACGCLPTKVMLGKCSVDMTKEFVAARNSNSTAALKDSFRMTDDDDKDCGEISMFLRISCFGKNIVTRFQGSSDPPRLGGGGVVDDGASCNPEKEYQTRDDPCVCSKGKGGLARKAGAGGGGCSQAPDPYNVMPCQDPDEPCYCSGPKAMAKQMMACRNTDPYCLHIPKDCCPPGNKVVFQLPADLCGTGHRQRAQFNLNTDGLANLIREEPGQVTLDKMVYPKQVYKLRFGKTVEMPGRKTKLEYQFIMPQKQREKVVPVKEERTAQCICRCPALYDAALKEQERLRQYVQP